MVIHFPWMMTGGASMTETSQEWGDEHEPAEKPPFFIGKSTINVQFFIAMLTGWWLTYTSEKDES